MTDSTLPPTAHFTDEEAVLRIAEEAAQSTLRADFGKAEFLLKDGCRVHPRLALEWAHMEAVKSFFNATVDGMERAAQQYLRVADMAEGAPVAEEELEEEKVVACNPWGVWAKVASLQLAGTPSAKRGSITQSALCWKPLGASPEQTVAATTLMTSTAEGDEKAKEEAEEEEEEERCTLSYPSGSHTATQLLSQRPSEFGTYQSLRPDLFCASTDWSQDATSLCSAVEDEDVRTRTEYTNNSREYSTMAYAAEARTVAGILLLRSNEYLKAGVNLRRAWSSYKVLRNGVHAGYFTSPLVEDVKVAVGLFHALLFELPDGLRKVLGAIAPLAAVEDESQWLYQVVSQGGPRSSVAGLIMVWQQLGGLAVVDNPAEAQVLQALLLRHPYSTPLHMLSCLQRRQCRDPQGALEAVHVARRCWLRPLSVWDAGRPRDGMVPPVLHLLFADTHFAAQNYAEAAKYYRKVLDTSAVTGERLDCTGRAALGLAGAMMMMGEHQWPGDPWGKGDEWLLKAVALAKATRKEEEASAATAARFCHSSQYRPLLGYWLMFIRGDLETLGYKQHQEMLYAFERMKKGNPGRPPADDFNGYAEGQAMFRLLYGALVRESDPEQAQRLWNQTIVDPRIGKDSVALAFTQCLLGELEATWERGKPVVGVNLIVAGSQLPGDRSLALRMRYASALKKLRTSSLKELLPPAWAILFHQGGQGAPTPATSVGRHEDSVPKEEAPVSKTWLESSENLMKARDETRGRVQDTLRSMRWRSEGSGGHLSATLRAAWYRCPESVFSEERPASPASPAPRSEGRRKSIPSATPPWSSRPTAAIMRDMQFPMPAHDTLARIDKELDNLIAR